MSTGIGYLSQGTADEVKQAIDKARFETNDNAKMSNAEDDRSLSTQIYEEFK